jgi:hypothetical protein
MSATGKAKMLGRNYPQNIRFGQWQDAGEFAHGLISAIMLMINKPVIEILQNSAWLINY